MSPAGCDYEMNAPCGQEGWELFPGSLHTYTPSQIPHYRPPSPCQCVMKLETEENSEGLQTDACSNEPFMGMMSLHERSGANSFSGLETQLMILTELKTLLGQKEWKQL